MRSKNHFSPLSSKERFPKRATETHFTHKFKLLIEYEGTRFSGWQVQPHAPTVQGEVMNAISECLETERFEFIGAGRTDAGVHALGQVAHLAISSEIIQRLPKELLQFRYALNDRLPPDINILNLSTCPITFHARHSAVARSYLFQISRRRTAFGKKLVWWIKDELDLDRMIDASSHFIGRVDFRHFTDRDPEDGSTLVEMQPIQFAEFGEMIVMRFTASHFLWKQIRRMMGVLAEVGRGKLESSHVADLLFQPNPLVAKLTSPPSGLFFETAYYDGDELPSEIHAPYELMMQG
ncbi:MAG: tRNA pseudouridine(38-40) synthase TruA [Chloroherpetonaceae bacterium]|nr:tRNA pseudouridine(38-40) synthase TruA [Chloroherpetonaceae bacterium]